MNLHDKLKKLKTRQYRTTINQTIGRRATEQEKRDIKYKIFGVEKNWRAGVKQGILGTY